MAVPLVPIALTLAQRFALGHFNKTLGVPLTALAGYLGYETFKEHSFPLPTINAPSGNNTVSSTLPTSRPSPTVIPPSSTTPKTSEIPFAPSMKDVLSVPLDFHAQSVERQDIATSQAVSSLETRALELKEKNQELSNSASGTFLNTQVQAKASLDEVGFAINAQTVVQAMIYETLDRNLTLIAGSLAALAQVGNVAPTANAQAVPDYSMPLDKLAQWATSAKVVSDHAQTEQDIRDLDGNLVARSAPMSMSATYQATKARTATDVNSQEFDLSDFNPISSLGLSILPFVGQSSIYNHDWTDSGNPFSPKSIF